ncbi:helix-turn-helix domain-containing protein [Verticiella sediminum]|uniref:Helix-turn-helix domain-containing protein n=1 Tax=Verticiella sediminum TaxID=1247510 RepID=A0A556AID2_9BURK|nr:helix-turn-helix domain-containing protein [Verticiella sediminum]
MDMRASLTLACCVSPNVYCCVLPNMVVSMNPKQIVRGAIKDAGGVGVVAKHFGLARTSVYEWIDRGEVPVARAVEAERTWGVSRRALRPSDWQLCWPELASPMAAAQEPTHA